MPTSKRIKKQPPGNVTTEQNAAQLLQAERTDPTRVTRTRAGLIREKGKPTPEAFDDLNATNPDAGKRREPRQLVAARKRLAAKNKLRAKITASEALIEKIDTQTDQTKTAPRGATAITSQELQAEIDRIRGTQQDEEKLVITLREMQATRLRGDIDQSFVSLISDSEVDNEDIAPIIQQVQDGADQEVIDASLNSLRIEDNILTKFDTMTYNFRLFMTGELATSNTLSNEDIVVIAETGSTGFNITDVDIKTIISPSLLTRNSYATNLKISIIEPHGNSLLDRMKNAADSLEVVDHKDVPLWFSISFKGYTQGENNGQNSHEGGSPTGELSEETRIWQIKLRRIEAEINKGGTEYIITAVPLNEQGLGDAARRLETDIKIDAFDLGEFFKNLSNELNNNENYSTQNKKARDDTERVRKYAFSLPRGDELNFAKNNNVPQINDMSTWEIRGENIADNKRTESFFSEDSKRKWRITFGTGTAIEAIIQEIIGTTVEGQSLALYGEKRGNTNDITPNEPREPTKPSIIFTVDPTVDITSYNGVARAYNTLNIYHIRPYLTFQPILSRKQIEDSLEERKSKERFAKQLRVTNIRKKYEYMFTGLNTEVLDYKIKFDRTWFLSLPIFQGQNRSALGMSSGFIDLSKSDLRILQTADARNDASQSLRAARTEELADVESRLTRASDAVEGFNLNQERQRLQREIQRIDITASEDAFTEVAIRARAKDLQQQALRAGARKIDTSTFGSDVIRLETDIQNIGGNINLLLESDIIISDAEVELLNEVKDRLRSKQNTKGSIFFAEDLDRLEQGVSGPDTSKNENQAHNNVATELSPTLHSSESGIEGTASKGRSFFSAVMNQIYGQKGQMRMIEMTIRGDPYWLGEPDVLKRLTISDANSRDITRSDSLILMTFAFPNGINDGGDNRGDSFEGTGLYNIDRKENGFNGVYYIRQVENKFSDGKFTQKLIGHADILTQESDVINAVINQSNLTGN